MKNEIGFIGTGIMGKPMAQRLLNANYKLVVYNRTRQKAKELLDLGAEWGDSPKEVAEKTNIVISMISTPEVLTEIAKGENGIINSSKEDLIHIDMSTVSAEVTNRLYIEYKKVKKNFMHAPVLGSAQNAVEGSILIFAGGDKSVFDKCKPIFEVLGKRIWYFEDIKKSAYLKLLSNQFIATMIVALSQGLVIAEKAGIPVDVVLEVLENSTLDSKMYQIKGSSIKEENYTPRFMTKHILKDVKLIIEASMELNIQLPMMEKIKRLFEIAVEQGYSEEDYSSVHKIIKLQCW